MLEPSVVVAVVSRVPIGLWVASLKTCITSSSGPPQPHTWLALPLTPQITLAWAFHLFLLMGRLGTLSLQDSSRILPSLFQSLSRFLLVPPWPGLQQQPPLVSLSSAWLNWCSINELRFQTLLDSDTSACLTPTLTIACVSRYGTGLQPRWLGG